MNIEVLRVYNAMHNLGLSEEQILAVNEEANNSLASGLKNFYKVKNDYLVYVDHTLNNGRDIRIKKCNIKLPLPSRIVCKTLITFEPPPQIYVLHDIGRYHKDDEWGYAYEAKNLEELKDRVIDKYKDKSYPDIDEFKMKAIFWLFNQEYDGFKGNYRKDVTTIAKVFETKNRRLAIFRSSDLNERSVSSGWGYKKTGEYDERVSYSLKVFRSNYKFYNWIDEGREIVNHLWLASELKGKINPSEARLLKKRLGIREYSDEEAFLSLSDYNDMKNAIRLDMMKAKQDYDEKVLKEKYDDDLINKFNKDEVITKGGIIFSKKGIEYEGYSLGGSFVAQFINDSRVLQEEEPDFNSLVTAYVNYIIRRVAKKPDTYKVIIGKVKSDLKVTAKKEACAYESYTNHVFYINNKRVRWDELGKILILSFNQSNQKNYDEWLGEVSKTSLRVKQALENGLSFKLDMRPEEDNDLSDKKVKQVGFNFKIVREKGKNYVLIKDNKYKIKSFDEFYRLKDLNQSGGMYYDRNSKFGMLIKRLSKLEGITPGIIGELLDEGKKYHNERVKRSEEFVQNAVRIVKAKKKGNGYVVKGVSGAEYHVEENSLRVHGWVKGRKANHICIVDLIDGHEENVDRLDYVEKNDALAKRLLALSKDKKIAGEVFTIKNHLSNREKGIIEGDYEEDEAQIINLVEA